MSERGPLSGAEWKSWAGLCREWLQWSSGDKSLIGVGRGRRQGGRGDRAQGKGEQKCDDHWRDTRGPRESVFSFFKVSTIIAYLYAKESGSVERD